MCESQAVKYRSIEKLPDRFSDKRNKTPRMCETCSDNPDEQEEKKKPFEEFLNK